MSDQQWQNSLRAVGKAKGPCPSADRLVEFLGGDLGREESARIIVHLASCGICDALVERMRRFDDPKAWQEADQRLAKRFEGFLSRQRSSVLSVLRLPWLAYVMTLLLIYPAYRGLVRQPVVQKTAPALSPVPTDLVSGTVLQLDAARSADVSKTVAADDREKVFILSFFVPIRNGVGYSADVRDSAGRVIAAQFEITSYDGKGNFYLVCDRRPFVPGRYVLTIKESSGANREFRFLFVL